MGEKPYRLGLLVGRFQMLHLGHERMVHTAVSFCDRVCLMVGSSQESGTEKNPFDYELRAELLRDVFGTAVEIAPLRDLGVGNNNTWGEYVLNEVRSVTGETPDLLVSGKEQRRVSWFDGIGGLDLSELYIPKTIEISASELRAYLLRGDRADWERFTNPALHHHYEALRALVMAAEGNDQTMSI